jgi:hypothetical protein
MNFLSSYKVEREDHGNFIKTVVVGQKTYEKVIGTGYPQHNDKDASLITKAI